MDNELENIKNKFIGQLGLDLMQDAAEKFQVTSEENARNALSMALQSRKLEKQMELTRVELTRPHVDYQRAVNKLAKDFKEKLESIEKQLHKKIDGWIQVNKDNPFISVEEIRVEDGILYTQKSWQYEIIDDSAVPREYLQINENRVESEIKKGIRNIPGIRIYQAEKTVLRVKNLEE